MTSALAPFLTLEAGDDLGTTSWGTPALDVPAVVRAALHEVGVGVDDRSQCTGCTPHRFTSHRRCGQRGRQVLTVQKRARA